MLPKIKKAKKLIYLDHAATTPLDPKVQKAMQPYLGARFGNASSLYMLGQQAKIAIETSRAKIAEVLNCRPQEIVFTAGGTESVNLAIFGVVRAYLQRRTDNPSMPLPHIVTSQVEHHAVLNSFKALEKEGVETTYLAVDQQGFVNQKELSQAIKPNTILVSLIYANNEIGTIQPIQPIAHVLHKINQERQAKNLPQIVFHTDACQAAGALDLNLSRLGVDLMSLNASKIYGPKQIGLLYKKPNVKITPLIYGGGQENDLRSGTENVAGIAGFAEALSLAQKNSKKDNKNYRGLRNYAIKKIVKAVPDIFLNGPDPDQDSDKNPIRLPNNISFSIAGVEGESLMLYLDPYNIAVATGSACTTAGDDPSHVILAIGRSAKLAKGTIRLTLGRGNKKSDIDYVLKVMVPLVKELRRLSLPEQSEDYLRK